MGNEIGPRIIAFETLFVGGEFAPEALAGGEELQVNGNAAEEKESEQRAEKRRAKVALGAGVFFLAAHLASVLDRMLEELQHRDERTALRQSFSWRTGEGRIYL